MIRVVSLLLLALCSIGAVQSEEQNLCSGSIDCSNHYWRRLGKIIPIDAVKGGYDAQNNTIYIGLGMVKNGAKRGVVPFGIYPNAEVQEAPLSGVVSVKNVHILCADPPSQLYWVKTWRTNFDKDMRGKHPIVAGSEDNEPIYDEEKVYIGRVEYKGQLLVGKVIVHRHRTYTSTFLYVVADGKELRTYHEAFEVLVANV